MRKRTAGDTIRYAKKYASLLTTGDASPLLQLTPHKRLHVLKALSSLAKFQGRHEQFQEMRRRYSLTWSLGNEALTTFEQFFDDSKTMDTMLDWVREAIRVLPSADMGSAIKFNCLTGLRPNEALQAIRLVKSGHPTISYYNQDRQCLEHFRYPEIFLRRTKSAYISLVDNQLLGIAQSIRKMPPMKPFVMQQPLEV